MKKMVLIILSIILLIVISIILFNTIILNNNEKEILSVLKDLDCSLQNPKEVEENTYSFTPSEPTNKNLLEKSIINSTKMKKDYILEKMLVIETNIYMKLQKIQV